ncbi:hypothetical protein NB693_23045 [Pantoea ananatis]|nr:hypothetical protein [Pantoea ananatis]
MDESQLNLELNWRVVLFKRPGAAGADLLERALRRELPLPVRLARAA